MQDRRRYLALDAMRGIAAIAVVWFHLHRVLGYDCAGPLAVDLFFVLSGFVVAAAYDRPLAEGMTVGDFARRRLIRMYPLFLAGLFVGLGVQLLLMAAGHSKLSGLETLASFVLAALWIPSPFNGSLDFTFPLDGPAWSLSFEIVANLLFAIFHRHLSDRLLMLVAAISGAVVIAGVLTLGTINFGWSWRTIDLGFARVMFSFPLGVLLYRHRHLVPASLGRIPPWLLLAGLGAVLLLPERAPIDVLFVLVGSPLLVAAGFRSATTGDEAAFQILGDISYPVYALHGPPVFVLEGSLKLLHLEHWGLPLALAYVVGIVLVAHRAAIGDARVRAALTRYLSAGRRTPPSAPVLVPSTEREPAA
ncbi:acyltransferase [Sphingomonas cannabina]|uniref:acyltransferase family protein n=1 Tax=Sphingomonas cannabina TaxID=2899123 RepID=UPI001F3F6156|nr:acyltransferase [Sphingomonas cannabina]UIJ44718.1 acyltransferase [Sphingomonas cannabina]